MKKTLIILCLIAFNITFAQSGKIYPKNNKILIGKENTYFYKPSKSIKIPKNVIVNIMFDRNKTSIPLTKKENKYQFSLKVSESVGALFMTITDKSNNIIDNNSDNGYVIFLRNKTEKEKLQSKLYYLGSCQMANYLLNLKIDTKNLIEKYDEIYEKNQLLKQGSSYWTYLILKYQQNPLISQPEIVAEAEKLSKSDDEKRLFTSSMLYSMLRMQTESEKINDLSRLKFPKGEIAKRDFIQQFYTKKGKTEVGILESLREYQMKFDDDSAQSKDNFYMALINLFVKKNDIINVKKYEKSLSNKQMVCNLYNEYAWKLSGENLTSPGENLPFAADLSKRSLSIIKEQMKNNNTDMLQGIYNVYADTYALILFKQKKYEEAFKYEDKIRELNGLDTGGKERYATIAEKARGSEFARKYIEAELKAGIESKFLVNQLQKIYKKLNLSESVFNSIKENSLKLTTQKVKEELIKMYGGIKAIDFTLTNLEGNKIKLSDYKGKMVVLDFWATWCGPCRASFPNMQKLVTKYKNKNIEFFFINTWERKSESKIKEDVSKFIKENKYSFNVLFDFEDKIVKGYKIKGIPTKIVIDKEGNIISINSSESNLDALIEENIK
jgi:thiol-disulfide isomerase/thioredoxin